MNTTPTPATQELARHEYEHLRPFVTYLDRWYPAKLTNEKPCEIKQTMGRGCHAHHVYLHIRTGPHRAELCTFYKNWTINCQSWTMKRTDNTGYDFT